MSSGVKVDHAVEKAFKEMQKDKSVPYLILKIVDDKEIQIETTGAPGDSFETFKNYLMEAKKDKQARYAIYDVYDEDDTGKNRTGKLLFLLWSDDGIAIKQKMLYTSSKAAMKKAISGYHKEMEVHCEEELTMEAFREKMKK